MPPDLCRLDPTMKIDQTISVATDDEAIEITCRPSDV